MIVTKEYPKILAINESSKILATNEYIKVIATKKAFELSFKRFLLFK